MSRARKLIIIFACLSAVIVPLGVYVVTVTVDDNSTKIETGCENVHTLYVAVDRIMVANGELIKQSKTLSKEEKEVYLKFNQDNRKVLAEGDCKA